MATDSLNWLNTPAEVAARRLLGCELVREIDGREIRVIIVETEAYDQTDEASHTFNGKTSRNAAMFKGAGHMYVYFTYGMHYCLNVVCGPEGFGSGVLIRAIEPVKGMDIIESQRGTTGINTTNGPAKSAQALSVNLTLSGHNLAKSPMRLIKNPILPDSAVTVGKRIGISKAVHELRRFYITGNPYVSKK